jgi:DNA-binding HxlR family transcriptional regulator
MVLHYLLRETLRFNRLQRLLGGVTHRTLARQLRELEADGIVSRKIYPVIPPRVEYSLTKEGRSLKPVLESMHAWGRRWSAGRRG